MIFGWYDFNKVLSTAGETAEEAPVETAVEEAAVEEAPAEAAEAEGEYFRSTGDGSGFYRGAYY